MNNNTFNNLSLDSIVRITGGDSVQVKDLFISNVTSKNGGYQSLFEVSGALNV